MKLTVIGAGPGGYVAAIKAAQLGASVTVIADTEVGGTCLNRGCIPTKALIASVDALSRARELQSMGVDLSGEPTPNLMKMMARKDRVVGVQVKGIHGLFKSWGIGLLRGRGIIKGQGKVAVAQSDGATRTIESDRTIIATGSSSAAVPAFPFDGRRILSSDDMLALTEVPRSILIIGAGAIGCEWACIMAGLGAKVTLVEMLPRAVATEDEEISAILARELKKKKIKLLTGTAVKGIEIQDDGVRAELDGGAVVQAELVLVSIGRRFNSKDIGLENAGVKTGKRGEILVDDHLRTSTEGVYAVGDVTGGTLLAHVASAQGVVAAHDACALVAVPINYDTVPAAIFTSPEIASVGLTEAEAEKRGVQTSIGRFDMRWLGKAHAMGQISGRIKVVAERGTGRLLGTHIIGPHASDIIHEAALAISSGLAAGDLAEAVHAHPTLSEGLMEAAADVLGAAIHVPKR